MITLDAEDEQDAYGGADNVDGAEVQTDLQHAPPQCVTPAWFQSFGERAGMLPEAPASWGRVYIHPHIACMCFFICSLTGPALYGFIYLGGIPLFQWKKQLAPLFHVVPLSINPFVFWRSGLSRWHTVGMKICSINVLIGVLAVSVSGIMAFIGPDSWTPFDNRLLFTVVNVVATWFFIGAGRFGGTESEIPVVPYKTFWPILAGTTWGTVRVMNPLTDMAVIRLLLNSAEEPCFLFGGQVDCSRFTSAAITFGVLVGVYYIAASVKTIWEAKLTRADAPNKMKWLNSGLYAVEFICESAIVALTLVKLFSDAQDPRLADDEEARRHQRINIAVTVVSFAITVIVYAASLRQVARWIARLQEDVTRRVSSAFSRASARPPMAATCTHSQSQPAEGSFSKMARAEAAHSAGQKRAERNQVAPELE